MKSSNYFHLIILSAILVTFGAGIPPVLLSVPIHPQPPTADRYFESQWSSEYFVLVKIVGGKQLVGSDNVSRTTYNASVLYDNKESLVNHNVTITGPQGNPTIGIGWNMPDLGIGDFVVFNVRPAKAPDAFLAQPGGTLPIGLAANLPLTRADAEDVHDAMKLANKFLPVKDAVKTHDESLMLFKSKNYFIWALGATMLALEATPDNISLLEAAEGDPRFTPNQFLWIDDLYVATLQHVIGHSVENPRPEFRNYMLRHTKKLLAN